MVGLIQRKHLVRLLTGILLTGVLLAGLHVRLSRLGDIPGFEHDEALICLGARDITESRHFPLTGDKVYEGPLLEYLAAFVMMFAGSSVTAVRGVMAVAGVLAILGLYWAGTAVRNRQTGMFAAIITLLSPWHLASSRVIYACNLSQLFVPVWIAATALYVKTQKTRWVIVSGFAVGFAANGRITAYLLGAVSVLLTIRFSKTKKVFSTALFITTALIPGLPVMVYNSYNGWPAFSILAGNGQSHLAHSIPVTLSRIAGYPLALLQVMSGIDFWLDVSFTPYIPVLVLPVCLATGVFVSLQKKASPILKGLAITFLVLLAILPVFIKTITGTTTRFHPHYLDLIMPFAVLLSAVALEMFESRRSGLGVTLCFLVLVWQGGILVGQLLPQFQADGFPGRWSGRSLQQAICTKKTFDTENTIVIVPWMFGSGYPQLRFLLPEFMVIPVVHPFYGWVSDQKQSVRIVFVSPHQPLPVPPWVSVQCGVSSLVYSVESPGFLLNGVFTSDAGKVVRITTQTKSDGVGRWPDLSIESDNLSTKVFISERKDHSRVHPAFETGSVHVSPRHAERMDRFREYVFAHSITGYDSHGTAWQIILPATVEKSPEMPAEIRVNDVIYSGFWKGYSVFY